MTEQAIERILKELSSEDYNKTPITINMSSTANIFINSVEDIALDKETLLAVCRTETGIKYLSTPDIEYIEI